MLRKSKLLLPIALALVTASCANMLNGPGQQNSVQMQLQALDTRVGKLSKQVDGMQRQTQNVQAAGLANQLNSLQAQMRELRGQIEQLSFQVQSNTQRSRQLYADLDQRLNKVETKLGLQTGGSGASSASSSASANGSSNNQVLPSGQERQDYMNAFNLLKSGQYNKAVSAFQDFRTKYPKSDYADNALYWKAEAEYANGNSKQALQDFESLENNYPDSSKLPGAMLKIGYIYYDQGQYGKARSILNKIEKNYPNTTAATLAQQRLTRMQQENK